MGTGISGATVSCGNSADLTRTARVAVLLAIGHRNHEGHRNPCRGHENDSPTGNVRGQMCGIFRRHRICVQAQSHKSSIEGDAVVVLHALFDAVDVGRRERGDAVKERRRLVVGEARAKTPRGAARGSVPPPRPPMLGARPAPGRGRYGHRAPPPPWRWRRRTLPGSSPAPGPRTPPSARPQHERIVAGTIGVRVVAMRDGLDALLASAPGNSPAQGQRAANPFRHRSGITLTAVSISEQSKMSAK